jgi:fucose 4-O-acetylase-like acetyltransferase
MRKDYVDVAKGVGIFFCLMDHVCDRHGIADLRQIWRENERSDTRGYR